VPLFIQILNSTIQSFPKVTGGEVMLSRTANSTLNDAESIAKKMNDELFHFGTAIFNSKSKAGQILKDQGN
jgi:ATP-dependent Clp protease ATP-binding subunit ClpB